VHVYVSLFVSLAFMCANVTSQIHPTYTGAGLVVGSRVSPVLNATNTTRACACSLRPAKRSRRRRSNKSYGTPRTSPPRRVYVVKSQRYVNARRSYASARLRRASNSRVPNCVPLSVSLDTRPAHMHRRDTYTFGGTRARVIYVHCVPVDSRFTRHAYRRRYTDVYVRVRPEQAQFALTRR